MSGDHMVTTARPHTRGGKGAAARTVGLLGGIFTFAQERGFVEVNPVRGLKRYKDNRRERFLSAAELARLGDLLTELEKDGGDPRHVVIIRLLLLTGARKNEIARLRWSEVDLEKGLLKRLANTAYRCSASSSANLPSASARRASRARL